MPACHPQYISSLVKDTQSWPQLSSGFLWAHSSPVCASTSECDTCASDLIAAGLGGCGPPRQGHCPLLQQWILAAFWTGTRAQRHMAESNVLSLWAVTLATYLASTSLPSDDSKQLIDTRCVCEKLGCWNRFPLNLAEDRTDFHGGPRARPSTGWTMVYFSDA